MSSDMGKPDVLLHQLQLVQILLVQSKPHSSGSNTEIYLIVEFYPAVVVQYDCPVLHFDLHLFHHHYVIFQNPSPNIRIFTLDSAFSSLTGLKMLIREAVTL